MEYIINTVLRSITPTPKYFTTYGIRSLCPTDSRRQSISLQYQIQRTRKEFLKMKGKKSAESSENSIKT